MIGAAHTKRMRELLRIVLGLATLALVSGLLIPAFAQAALVAGCVLVALLFIVTRRLGEISSDQIAEHDTLREEAQKASRQTEQLFAMTDMLQSADSHEDAASVLEATAQFLMPEFLGALYIFNNSRDRLDCFSYWPKNERSNPVETLLPSNCWALKRGKQHFNNPHNGTLRCDHNNGSHHTLEIPMIARGNVHGLLMLAIEDEDGQAKLQNISRVARALAESMSLALSNIALREKLKTQSLRDPLTGLYNRRYMEDALERFIGIGERDGGSTSVIMIDLDHFKTLNDEFGHAKGDAVLRDVASQLVSAVRPTDVVCRYGGEELLVVMPRCNQEDAAVNAEILRTRIESLSAVHDARISASFGVAAVPQNATGGGDVIALADAALYQAKEEGRNCVRLASQRKLPKDKITRLAS